MKRIKSANTSLQIWENSSDSSVQLLPSGKNNGLYIRIPKIREQLVSRYQPASACVCLYFNPATDDLCIELANSVYSIHDHINVAFDCYTNRYPEYPATFIVEKELFAGKKYFVDKVSDYRGDFILITQIPDKRRKTPTQKPTQVFIINVSAVFMFESLKIKSSGKIFYRGKFMQQIGTINPFLLQTQHDTLYYSIVERFKSASYMRVQQWLPYMLDIQSCDAINSGGREPSTDDQKAFKRMGEVLEKLP